MAIQRREISVFYSYAHEDEKLMNELEKHLGVLKRMGMITTWHDRKIRPGEVWEGKIDEHLESSQVILLLVSADFVASDYCWEREMVKALQLHALGQTVVIPILLREVAFLDKTPFGKLQMLPKDARPITRWKRADQAWSEVAEAIGKVCEELQGRSRARVDEETAQRIYEQIAADAERQRTEREEIMKGVTKLILNTPNLDIPPKPRFSAIDAYISESWPDVDQEKQEGSDEH
ncbi:MAG TPA: toll/interleukin-1 receptor domain-containing protein [Thermoanaerobaculia bacterium]